MNLKDKIFIVYCPACDDIYSIQSTFDNASSMRWKHYWKSKEGHVKEDDIIIREYSEVKEDEYEGYGSVGGDATQQEIDEGTY